MKNDNPCRSCALMLYCAARAGTVHHYLNYNTRLRRVDIIDVKSTSPVGVSINTLTVKVTHRCPEPVNAFDNTKNEGERYQDATPEGVASFREYWRRRRRELDEM